MKPSRFNTRRLGAHLPPPRDPSVLAGLRLDRWTDAEVELARVDFGFRLSCRVPADVVRAEARRRNLL